MNFLTAEVDIVVDDSQLSKQLSRAKRTVMSTVGRIEGSFSGMAANFKATFDRMSRYAKWGAVALAGIGIASVKMAMDVEEAENLFEVSMGSMADSTRRWSEEVADSLKVTAFGIRRMVSTFNVMLDSMGLAPEKAAAMSQSLTKLTYDMASFYNLRPEEAFQKLQAGISGEAEPLKRLGILINETTVKQYAMNKGMIKGGETLSEVGKVVARYGAIMEQTQKAQGDMERTMGSTTNVLRSLWDLVKGLAITLGQALLPMVNRVGKQLRDWLFANQEQAAMTLISIVEQITLAIGAIAEQLIKLPAYWKKFEIAALEAAIKVYKVADAVTNLDELFAWVRGDTKTFKNEIKEMSAAADQAAKEYLEATSKLEGRLPAVKKVFEEIRQEIRDSSGEARDFGDQATDMANKWLAGPEEETGGVTIGPDPTYTRDKTTDTIEKQKATFKDFKDRLRSWAFDAADSWRNFGEVFSSSLDRASNTLTDFAMKGKADFDALAESILADLTNMIIKGMLARALGLLLPGGGAIFGAQLGTSANPMVTTSVPKLDDGGTVMKTGLAVVHRGETFSGVGNKNSRQSSKPVTLNLNVNAIDAAGTHQFLKKNKRAIAGMIQSAMKSNNPLRRSDTGWK